MIEQNTKKKSPRREIIFKKFKDHIRAGSPISIPIALLIDR